jgi:hypothetical protein
MCIHIPISVKKDKIKTLYVKTYELLLVFQIDTDSVHSEDRPEAEATTDNRWRHRICCLGT